MLGDDEYREIEAVARAKRLTVSEWARQALRWARRREPLTGSDRKLATIRSAVRHEFPTDDIDTMLEQIEHGYTRSGS
jgi:hypothetical protein